MATREEIETLIEQVKSQITSTQTSLAEAMNQTSESGAEEASRGHHGIATLYQSGRQKLEESHHQIASSITLLEEAKTLISQAQGLPTHHDGG
ncbi:hypothetical protein FB566_0464 [Stackebrandtia endophytica]|uniref:Uncharacterized protein n=1 Tax=Stackebrandtia endophytica TaxID=1496996 RepID=A0A543AQW0_9ACTN|nr:hypothetical protein [Stackebrandtia endophytica]TQL74973.1 hypothetical protein FB566_0464 [Stackebrandtia endophytica]